MGTKNYFACTRSGISYSKINSVRNENIQRFILQEIVCKELLCQKKDISNEKISKTALCKHIMYNVIYRYLKTDCKVKPTVNQR